MFTDNILKGFYSPPSPYVDLSNGPGYPILLIPFIALKLPYITITLLNAVFHYLSIIFLFKAIQIVTSFKKALIFSLFWACYYIGYQYLSAISYEPISIFFVSLLIFSLIKTFIQFQSSQRRYAYLSGFVLGYLALTKVVFGYILFAMLIIAVLLWIMNKAAINNRKGVIILSIACLTTLPWLIYTYNVTGRIFFWGTGQDNLYWMTTPYDDEYGDWKGDLTRNTVDLGNYNVVDAADSLKAHHQKDFEDIYGRTGLARDDEFRRIAINNIKAHPGKYIKNIFCNIGRIFFHYPFSYAVQRIKILFVLPINGIVLALILFCLIPTIKSWRKIIYPLRFLLILGLMYLAASSLLCAETRVLALLYL